MTVSSFEGKEAAGAIKSDIPRGAQQGSIRRWRRRRGGWRALAGGAARRRNLRRFGAGLSRSDSAHQARQPAFACMFACGVCLWAPQAEMVDDWFSWMTVRGGPLVFRQRRRAADLNLCRESGARIQPWGKHPGSSTCHLLCGVPASQY